MGQPGCNDVTPCVECIVYAACRSKNSIKCEILYQDYIKKFSPLVTLNDKMYAGSRLLIAEYLVYLNKSLYYIFESTHCIILTK